MGSKRKSSKPARPSRVAAWWRGIEPQRRLAVLRASAVAVVTAAVLSAGCYGMLRLERYVLSHHARQVAPTLRVVLVDPPAWLPQQAVRRIEISLTPPGAHYSDADLTRRVHELATREPWLKSVGLVTKHLAGEGQVGVVQVRAEYRQAYAQVRPHRGSPAWYVDREGVVLPDHEVPRWVALVADSAGRLYRDGYYCNPQSIPAGVQAAPIHYITVQGVRAAPVAAGYRWGGADLADGLRLVELVFAEPYASQIRVVDVSNHDGRVNPRQSELMMYAYCPSGAVTEIRFGRFPRAAGGDHVICPFRKKAYLDGYAAENGGQLAGQTAWLDLRYDELRVYAAR